jgi:16S rRNA (adenine1518-N6/adenine1519-N6)-dimethyltransferase
MQKLGQHFLKNAKILDAIVAALRMEAGDRVIEIGPGHGELTLPLVRATEKFGARAGATIISIEKDHALISSLAALGEKEAPGRITIIEGDALKLLPDIVRGVTSTLNSGVAGTVAATYKIVGNIPYYITGQLLRVISELDHKPDRTVLMIQKEVAERICSAPRAMNRLAASVQFWADATLVAVVPKKDFSPPPEVDSAIIVLDTKKSTGGAKNKSSIEPGQYYKTVRGIFSQPRKTLLNNLVAMGGGEKEKIAGRLAALGIDPAARPQDLAIEQIIAIANAVLWR